MKIFETKDSKVSNRKFESFHRKDSETECSLDEVCEVSIGKILMIPNFESSYTKDSENHGRSRSRTNEQIYLLEEFQQRTLYSLETS